MEAAAFFGKGCKQLVPHKEHYQFREVQLKASYLLYRLQFIDKAFIAAD